MKGLSEEEVANFDRDGFLIVKNYATREDTARLSEVAWGYAKTLHAGEVFTTEEQGRKTGDLFMDSAYGITPFLEEEAVGADGELLRAKEFSVNKIGHALHELDPIVRDFTSRCEEVSRSLGLVSAVIPQSMLIFKQPRIGGKVVEHRDSTFLWTDPPSCIAYWLALEDATTSNGCLWAVPGSHKDPVETRFAKEKPGSKPAVTGGKLKTYEESSWIPLPVCEGDLVLLHGALCHRSASNRSEKTRLIYTFHVIEGPPRATWSPQNWLQRSPDAPFPTFPELRATAK